MGRRPFLRTLPSWGLWKFPGKMLTLPGLNPSLLVAALPPRLESVRAFLYYAVFSITSTLVFLLYCLGLSPDMGSIPSTIPPTDADSLAAVILSTFAELTPEVTSVPLELTAAYSKCRAGITAYSTVNAYSPGRAIQTNPPESSNRLSLWLSPSS